jgi:hypothetical protein
MKTTSTAKKHQTLRLRTNVRAGDGCREIPGMKNVGYEEKNGTVICKYEPISK